MENRVINAAILGAGTVGGGVYKLAQAMEEDIFHKTGARLVIKKMLVRNVNKERKGIPSEILTDDWNSIINDPEIDIIVELMGDASEASYISDKESFEMNLRLFIGGYVSVIEDWAAGSIGMSLKKCTEIMSESIKICIQKYVKR